MGCCCSCNEEQTSVNAEVNERSLLIPSPTSTFQNISDFGNGSSAGNVQRGYSSEHSVLLSFTVIIDAVASEFIDITAADGFSIEQQDLKIRANHYSYRLQQQLPRMKPLLTNPLAMRVNDSNVEPLRILQMPCLSLNELRQITTTASRISNAVHGMRAVGRGQLVISLATHI